MTRAGSLLPLLTVFIFSHTIYAADTAISVKTIAPKSITKIGELKNRALQENSGFARSNIAANTLWTITDSDTPNSLYAIDLQGNLIATVNVEDARNTDWEAINSFRVNNAPYLLIADIGDNHAERDIYTLYVVREPDLSETKPIQSTRVEWKIHFRYEDGAKDAESIAVEPERQSIIIISKRTTPPMVYELPFQPANDMRFPAMAKLKTKLNGMVKPDLKTFLFGGNAARFSGQPTDLAISPDGRYAAVLTYLNIYRYERKDKETWAQTFAQIPHTIDLPDIPQAESIEWDHEGKALFVSSEMKNPPLYRIELP